MSLLLGLLQTAHAEGAADFGGSFYLVEETVIYAEVFDGEGLSWAGTGDLEVRNASGTLVSTLEDGGAVSLSGGRYTLTVTEPQRADWDISVTSASTNAGVDGRIYSTSWVFTTESSYLKGSFFARIKTAGGEGLAEITLDNVVGDPVTLRAAAIHSDTAPTQSIPMTLDEPTMLYPLFLNVPDEINHSDAPPSGGDLSITTEAQTTFSFTADQDGTHAICCDTSGDGVFDFSGVDDWLHFDVHDAGPVTVVWDAHETAACQVWLLSGSLHVSVGNASTAYPGVRLHERPAKDPGAPEPMRMLWDDTLVADDALLYNGEETLDYPLGGEGMWAGDYAEPSQANANARAWGDFTGKSRGVDRWMLTWSAIEGILLDEVSVDVETPADTAADTAALTPERSVGGALSGGACRCSTHPTAPHLGLWLVALYGLARRRPQPSARAPGAAPGY